MDLILVFRHTSNALTVVALLLFFQVHNVQQKSQKGYHKNDTKTQKGNKTGDRKEGRSANIGLAQAGAMVLFWA